MNKPNFLFKHPKGIIYGIITPHGLSELHLPTPTKSLSSPTNKFVGATAIADKLIKALNNYFAGQPESFDDILLAPSGTQFQQQVWAAARAIRWGESCSYGELGKRMGRSSNCARAIGGALGANPIPIIIPCHRILAHNGKLGGYSGGLDWKRELLGIEHVSYSRKAI